MTCFEPTNSEVRFLPLRYSRDDGDESALRLVIALRPDWTSLDSNVCLERFTDGITNTLLKAVNRKDGLSNDEIDQEAILLRAYGHGTDLIIDRQREAQNHELLMHHGLAPRLLARFENGMMYSYVRGSPTRPEDLRRPDISAAIARRLGQWHATVPCVAQEPRQAPGTDVGIVTGKLEPNLWSVMQKWIFALPANTSTQVERKEQLQKELFWLADELSQRPGLGEQGLVFSHNDLLSGNVIVLPPSAGEPQGKDLAPCEVTFIDYEYAVPSPAAFDIANHFAEWGGFDCDMSVIPTAAQRRAFIDEYTRSFARSRPTRQEGPGKFDIEEESASLMREVDVYRGVPGFFWGTWSLIQSVISEIDFDYASYAETRLSEYWEWKREASGERAASGAPMSVREARWAQASDGDSS